MNEFGAGNIGLNLGNVVQGQKIEKATAALSKIGKIDNDNKKMEEACHEFESLFIYQMLKEMRATVPRSELFGGGRAEEIYTSMMDEQLSQEMSRQKGIGLSGLLLHQLSQIEASQGKKKQM